MSVFAPIKKIEQSKVHHSQYIRTAIAPYKNIKTIKLVEPRSQPLNK